MTPRQLISPRSVSERSSTIDISSSWSCPGSEIMTVSTEKLMSMVRPLKKPLTMNLSKRSSIPAAMPVFSLVPITMCSTFRTSFFVPSKNLSRSVGTAAMTAIGSYMFKLSTCSQTDSVGLRSRSLPPQNVFENQVALHRSGSPKRAGSPGGALARCQRFSIAIFCAFLRRQPTGELVCSRLSKIRFVIGQAYAATRLRITIGMPRSWHLR
mmetsp:Transcript_43537/g.118252  ORF Transcript_43537/g.118252 Transcript_43537/m.118252 type:complete len:211 (-) Transcript_43537:482-1114(-)